MKADKFIYEISSTVYGQPLTLTYSRDTGGKMTWVLSRGQANQLDDSTYIAGLTGEVILRMAEAVKSHNT